MGFKKSSGPNCLTSENDLRGRFSKCHEWMLVKGKKDTELPYLL
jgi:hypothetical protein